MEYPWISRRAMMLVLCHSCWPLILLRTSNLARYWYYSCRTHLAQWSRQKLVNGHGNNQNLELTSGSSVEQLGAVCVSLNIEHQTQKKGIWIVGCLSLLVIYTRVRAALRCLPLLKRSQQGGSGIAKVKLWYIYLSVFPLHFVPAFYIRNL